MIQWQVNMLGLNDNSLPLLPQQELYAEKYQEYRKQKSDKSVQPKNY